MKISNITNLSELKEVFSWIAKEGWNPGLNDPQTFFQSDPRAFFIGKLNGTPVALASAAIYDHKYAFFGCLVVHPEYRDKGYGLEITRARLNYVGNNRTVGLDGVVNMQSAYQTNGFYLVHKNFRYQLTSQKIAEDFFENIVPVSKVPWHDLCTYDTQHFFTARESFLKAWMSQLQSYFYVSYKNEKIQGYAVMRPCLIGYKIGPLFADSSEIAEQLLSTLLIKSAGAEVYIDIPEVNTAGVAMLKRLEAKLVFETGRMYRNSPPQLPLQNIYGLTTYEFG